MTEEQNKLKDLCYQAYLAALRPDPVRNVLDKLQDAYWQGLDMMPDDEYPGNYEHRARPF